MKAPHHGKFRMNQQEGRQVMVIDNKYEIEQTVYLKTDTEQLQRVVTAITIKPMDLLVYELSCGRESSDHYEFEISDEMNVEIKVK